MKDPNEQPVLHAGDIWRVRYGDNRHVAVVKLTAVVGSHEDRRLQKCVPETAVFVDQSQYSNVKEKRVRVVDVEWLELLGQET